jgi:HK97 gp10 family phage protein
MGIGVRMTLKTSAVQALARKLNEVDRKAARKAVRVGVGYGTKAVLDTAKSLVPRDTGLLRKSLGRLIKTYRAGKVMAGIVGPRKSFVVTLPNGKRMRASKYAHLVELGRREVVPKKKRVLADKAGGVFYGERVRAVPPRPFMRPAWERHRAKIPWLLVRALNGALREFAANARGR